jgi:hypothetical protein
MGMKQNTKYISDCVLCFYTSLLHIVPLSFDTTPPALNKFFEPVGVEFFRLFSKPWGKREVHTGFWWGDLKESDHLGDPDVDGG